MLPVVLRCAVATLRGSLLSTMPVPSSGQHLHIVQAHTPCPACLAWLPLAQNRGFSFRKMERFEDAVRDYSMAVQVRRLWVEAGQGRARERSLLGEAAAVSSLQVGDGWGWQSVGLTAAPVPLLHPKGVRGLDLCSVV